MTANIHMNSDDTKAIQLNLTFFDHLSKDQRGLLEAHLLKRFAEPDRRSGLGVVFDITRWCNQGCILCCTNAKRVPSRSSSYKLPVTKLELNTLQVFKILHKLKAYAENRKISSVFINFGGGEPFLRPDFTDILLETAQLFGSSSVGFDTNGTKATPNDIEKVKDHVSYIGISLDGLESYHNRWRRAENENGFQQSVSFIRSILELPNVQKKLEVSTVVTKDNLTQIPELMRFLYNMGVCKYSIHRTMHVGRAWLNRKADGLIPNARDYLDLMVAVLETNRELGLEVHLHHSIESIYATLLLGLETYSEKLGDPDRRSSIGVDWYGHVYFDPWCLVEPLSLMFVPFAPSLVDDNVTLENILHKDKSDVRDVIQQSCLPSKRCLGCPMPCSGGSRVAAALYNLRRDGKSSQQKQISVESILTRLDQIDPVCPLLAENNTSWVKVVK